MRATTRIGIILAACAAIALGLSLRTTTAQATTEDGRGMIATVDVVQLLEDMLQTPEYLEPREAIREDIQNELAEGEQQLIALEAQLTAMTDRSTPEFQQGVMRFQQLQQSLQDMTQAKAAEYDQASARQAVAIYGRVSAAADTVGQRLGYRYVIASRPTDANMNPEEGFSAIAQQVLARPMVFGAENDDITAAVRAELGIPEQTEDDAAADAADENAGG
ncbi:MAG: OmpH family outer membrane protein [Phycisphaerales bacterium]